MENEGQHNVPTQGRMRVEGAGETERRVRGLRGFGGPRAHRHERFRIGAVTEALAIVALKKVRLRRHVQRRLDRSQVEVLLLHDGPAARIVIDGPAQPLG